MITALWVVVVLHAVFAVAEILLWETLTPLLGIFKDEPGFTAATKARLTAPLGRNTGIYNGILSLCLFWALWHVDQDHGLVLLLLGCVIVAGLYGGLAIKWPILLVQALPAAVALGWIVSHIHS
jgi:putative membrane protein